MIATVTQTGPAPIREVRSSTAATRKTLQQQAAQRRVLKQCIWAYLALLIFEGALRKWVLPGLSTPLLVIRDPVAVAFIALAYRYGFTARSNYVTALVIIGIVSLVVALTLGHGSPVVALYGVRPLLIHIPFAFIASRVLTREDIRMMGRAGLLISIPMALLIGAQFYSPQSAWVNRGVGGDISGAGFSGAMGYMRPPGTFSFTDGTTSFFSLVAAFIGYYWVEPERIDRRLLIAATVALIVAIPLAISRALVFQSVITFVFMLFVMLQTSKFRRRAVTAIAGLSLAAFCVSFVPVFQNAVNVLMTRFSSASDAEGGLRGTLGDRFLGGLLRAVQDAWSHDILGQGIGLGTNVAAVYATGSRTFAIAEQEWGRIVGELGPILGLLLIAIRVSIAVLLLLNSYKRASAGDALGWMLMSVASISIVQGGWAQPTPLGFCTVTLMMCLTAAFGQENLNSGLAAKDGNERFNWLPPSPPYTTQS